MAQSFPIRLHGLAVWSLVTVLLASLLAFTPTPVQAGSATAAQMVHSGRWGTSHPMIGGFWITGNVTAIEDGKVSVRLPDREHARGFMRNVSIEVTMAVSDDTILFGNDLAPIAATDLQEGDEVVIVPQMVWGNLTARMLFVGEPEDLADHTYRGRLVSEVDDTLTLDGKRENIEVVVDENTIWYEQGRVDRPAELPEDAPLRVLGVEQEDGTIRAVMVTSATRGH